MKTDEQIYDVPETVEKEKGRRIDSVDLLRGLVMVIMALDHARYPYFGSNLLAAPEDLANTNLPLFLTRWITHFCAPLFFLLAGTGAFLSLAGGKTVNEISKFFWTRGLWLIFLELTVIAFAWSFNPYWRFGGVIWALGWSMIFMALVVRLPLKFITAFAVLLIGFHNLLDGIKPSALGDFAPLWTFLHSPGVVDIKFLNAKFIILYVLIPWLGIMAAGYSLGQVFAWSAEKRRRWLLFAGAVTTTAFFILRAANIYGNPTDFQVQATAEKTVIAFLNVEKYPASLDYVLMTIGPALMLLSWFERFDYRSAFGWLGKKILVFGRVPMFFYILHLFTLHLMAIVAGLFSGQQIGWLWGQRLPMTRPVTDEYGFGLPFVYLMTILAVVLLYFPCKWFSELKKRRRDWWLRYL